MAGWVYQTGYGGSETFFPVGNSHAYQAGTGGWSVDSAYNASGIYVSFNDQTHLVSQAALNFNSGVQPPQMLNQWMFVAVIFDRSAGLAYAYVNGVQQSATVNISSVTGDVVSSENVVLSDLAGWYMQSSMDDVRIYNRALSAAEVMALYNAEK